MWLLRKSSYRFYRESKSGHWFITTKFATKQGIANSINITVKDIIICIDHAVCSRQTLLFTIPQMVSVQFPLFYLVSSQNKTLVKLRTLSLLVNLFLSCSTWILTFCTSFGSEVFFAGVLTEKGEDSTVKIWNYRSTSNINYKHKTLQIMISVTAENCIFMGTKCINLTNIITRK